MTTSHDYPRPDSPSGLSISEFELSSRAAPDWIEEDAPQPEPVDAALLVRRRQLRSWVGRGMFALALLTLAAVCARGIQRPLTAAEASPLSAHITPAAAVVTRIDPVATSVSDPPGAATPNVVAPESAKADVQSAKHLLAADAAPKVSKPRSNPKKRPTSQRREPARAATTRQTAPRKSPLLPMPF